MTFDLSFNNRRRKNQKTTSKINGESRESLKRLFFSIIFIKRDRESNKNTTLLHLSIWIF